MADRWAGALLGALLLTAAGPAAGAGPAPGSTSYAGKTAQGHVIAFHTNAAGNRIVGMRINILVGCSNKTAYVKTIRPQRTDIVALDATGRFASHGPGAVANRPGGGTFRFAWHGRINGGTVIGSARLTEQRRGGIHCDSRVVGYRIGRSHT